MPAALNYAQASGLPFEMGIIRNHYVGRTFIEPTDRIRHMGVRLKHNPNRRILEGKRVILVEDSIVRSTDLERRSPADGARSPSCREVHFRVANPPTTAPASTGSTRPNKDDLLASHMNVEEMRHFIQADSLSFLSMDGMYRAVGEAGHQQQTSRNSATPASPATFLDQTDRTMQRRPQRQRLSLLAKTSLGGRFR